MKKLSLLSSIVAGLMLCACNGNEDIISESSEFIKGINVSIEDANYDLGLSTRSSYVVDPARGFISSWTEGDTLGIYPIGGDQVAFPISEGEGSKTAKFDGGAWALRSSFQYAAYYPFNRKNYYVSEKEIPVTYTGQTQTANNSTTHLAAYDYLAAAATSPNSEGNVNLSMKRLGCFARFQIPIKVSGTYTEFRISTSEASLTAEGTVDLQAATPSITPKTTVSSLSVTLNNIVVENGETLVVYAMLAPADLNNQTLTLTLKNVANKYYYYTIAGYNMVAGKAYDYSITNVPNANGHDYVDLGLPSGTLWATMNIGANTPEESGEYYAWGEVETKTESVYDSNLGVNAPFLITNYKYCTATWVNNSYYRATYTKYCPTNSTQNDYTRCAIFDDKFFLDEEDDVAHVKWGGSWRMPTITEQEELVNNCTKEFVTINSKTVLKATGPNGNYILLPLYGYYGGNGYNTYTSCYWSNTINIYISGKGTNAGAGKCMSIRNENNNVSWFSEVWPRHYGLMVRAVL